MPWMARTRATIVALLLTILAQRSAADEPASQPARTEPTEAAAIQTVKAYHALLVSGEIERAVAQYFDVDQIMFDTIEEAFRELDSTDRRRLRELFFPAMEPVMAHPAMRQILSRSRFGDYTARTRANGRVIVEFISVFPNGERRTGWVVLHHFDGRWHVLDLGQAGSGGFVAVLRGMWKKARTEQTPVQFFEGLAADAAIIMKRATTTKPAR